MSATFATTDLSCLAAAAAPIGLFLLDEAGDATFVNSRLGEMLGVPADALLGTELVARILGEMHVGDVARITESLALGASGESVHEPRVRCAAGWLRIVASRTCGAEGIVGVVEDVTRARVEAAQVERANAARERARLHESLGTLAGKIAHDVNNMLVGIVGNATLLEFDVDPTGDAAMALADLRLSAEQATELTGQLLAFGGRKGGVARPVDAVAIVGEALGAPAFAGVRSRIVHADSAAQPTVLPAVLCDPARLEQSVTHLVANAVEALGESSGGVTVSIGLTTVDTAHISKLAIDGGLLSGTHVSIEIEDCGAGMSPAALDRAFEPWVTTKFKRRGLGLPMVAAMVRSYKAGLEAISVEGAGTTMRLLLPIDPSQPVKAPAPSASDAPHDSGTILVVDDESAMRDVTRRLLARRGYEVLEASSGEEGLRLLTDARARVRCVLLDHSMPGMDGAETLRRMRSEVPDAHVVITSGYSERDLRATFEPLGVAGYLQKPFDLSDLLRAALGHPISG